MCKLFKFSLAVALLLVSSFGKSNGSYDFQPYSGRVFSIVNENNENEVIRDTNSELVAPQTDVKDDVSQPLIIDSGDSISTSDVNGTVTTTVKEFEEFIKGDYLYHIEKTYNPQTKVTKKSGYKIDIMEPNAVPQNLTEFPDNFADDDSNVGSKILDSIINLFKT